MKISGPTDPSGSPLLPEPSAIIIPFGKHKGKTVAELLATDQPYADWITAQGWVAERFAELHAAIVTRSAGADDTPEHNALQARFLDEGFRRGFLLLCAKDLRERITEAKRLLMDSANYVINLFDHPKYGWETISQARYDNAKSILEKITSGAVRIKSTVQFEVSGIDVFITYGGALSSEIVSPKRISVELKPALGDDYPSVMRQMQRLHCSLIVVGQYTGRGVSEPQLRQMFEANDCQLVFVQEIEERIRNTATP
jgi:uncharacterized protein (DUF3820 family)